MRTNGGNYTIQQALTVESSSIVKQALNLAKRRGHSHVTPLHVASAMLVSSSSALFREACFQTHSHPLQYKALEICFNVALNRLPTSASSTILEPRVHLPCLSNALIAAFKRAQAYQRRGSIENQQQQQHLKVEIEQLVISILDDPSVSRVMSEAGFSSIQLKTNVEHAISSEISTKPMATAPGDNLKLSLCKSGDDPSVRRVMREAGFSSIQLKTNVEQEHTISSEISCKKSTKPTVIAPNNLKLSLCRSVDDQVKNDDDVMSVIEAMMNKKRRNTVIIGECLAIAEGVVRGVIDKFDKGEVPLDMQNVQFISVPLFTLRNVSKEDFKAKIEELRILLRSYIDRGVVLYLGDLGWISEFWTKHNGQVMELSRLFCGEMKENGKLWVMGIASFQTYMNCETGCPSLQTLWDLHPLTIPVVNLALSLNLERTRTTLDGSKVKTESTTSNSSPSLPSWLQQYKEVKRPDNNNIQEPEELRNPCKKWNSIYSSAHKHDHNFLSPSSPCTSTSISSSNKSKKEHQFLNTKPELLSNPNSSPNTASSSEASGYMEHLDRFKKLDSPEMLPHSCRILQKLSGGSDMCPLTFLNSPTNIDIENMKILCKALEEKVPWQKDIIPDIVSTILECRHKKEEAWLLFLGADSQGKEKMSRELAKIIFGSQDNFISIGLSTFSSSTRTDSTDQEVSNKRSRDEQGRSYFERLANAIQENPSRVFFMEDIDQVDSFSQKGIQKAIETGKLTLPNGDLVFVKDSIVIFSCEEYFSSISRTCSTTNIQKIGGKKREYDASLDLNIGTGIFSNEVENFGIFDVVDKQIMFKIQVLM